MKRAALALCFLLALSAPALADGPIASVDDLVALAEGGLTNETILVFVRNRPVAFAGSAEEILRLKEAGVSEEVIRYLLEHAAADDGEYSGEYSEGYAGNYPSYASSSYHASSLYYPRSYYGSLYVGTLLYPSLWYGQRYHGSRVIFRNSYVPFGRHRSRGLYGRRYGGTLVIGNHQTRGHLRRTGHAHRGHGIAFSTGNAGGHFGGHFGRHRALHSGGHAGLGRFGAGRGAGFRGHRGGHFGGARGGFQGGARAEFGGGFHGGHAGRR